MFAALGRAATRHRWQIVGVWLALLAAALPLALRAPSVLQVGGFSSDQIESAVTRRVLLEDLDYAGSGLLVIFRSATRDADDPRFAAAMREALRDVATLPQVKGITYPDEAPQQVGHSGRTAYALIRLTAQPQRAVRLLDEIRARMRPTELEATLAGGLAFYADIERLSEEDLRRAELIALPFALLALLLVFRTVVAAALPAAVGGASVAVGLAVVYLLAQRFDLSIFALNVTTMLGLGLGVDYALFLVSRFREELRQRAPPDAVAAAVATAGRAIFFSGSIVFVGLLALTTFDFMMLRSIGVAGAIVVAMCVLAALTLLPALLALLGPRVDLGRVLPQREGRGRLWAALAEHVMRRPVAVLLTVALLLVALGAPFLRVRLSSPDASILPPDTPSRQGFELLRREFGAGELGPVLIAVKTVGPVTAPESLSALYDFTQRIAADPRVARVDSIVSIDSRITKEQYLMLYAQPGRVPDAYARAALAALVRGDTTLVQVIPRVSPTAYEAQDLVRGIRALPRAAGMRIWVDGTAAEVLDVTGRLYEQFPRALLLIVVAIYLVLLVQFRSLVLPLKAVAMNTLSILASYGALVLVFQDGHLSWLLGHRALGFVESSLPIILFCILYGLSMDYEVFLLSRVREAYDETGDNTKSVALGLERSGQIITSAAAVVIVVSLAFVAADIVLVKALGLGVAIAVFVDATIVRALLVPATMRLLGDLNWWAPRWLARWLPRWGGA
ncbi:MAG: MMPL family transporter [Chloroflexi bacterium]|nr:MMPL family transporter [Chloroflexota bacterium]